MNSLMYSESMRAGQRRSDSQTYVALRLVCEKIEGQTGEVVEDALMDTLTGTAIELCKEFTGVRFAHIHARGISLILNTAEAPDFHSAVNPIQNVIGNIFREISTLNGHELTASFSGEVLQLNSTKDLFLYVDGCRGEAIEHSVNKAVEALYPTSEFADKNIPQRMSMLFNTKYRWGNLPESFRFGQYIKKQHHPRTMKPMWVAEPALLGYKDHHFTH